MKKILLSAAVLLLSLGTYAQNNPTSLSTDTRIKKVVYRENDVIPSMAFPLPPPKFNLQSKNGFLILKVVTPPHGW